MSGEPVFVDPGPLTVQLEAVAGLLAAPPPAAALQRSVAEQARTLLQSLAALPRTAAEPEGAGWTVYCEGQSVEVSREGVSLSGMLGPSGDLLWLDAHVEPGIHWHVVFEETFSGTGALEALLGSSGGGAAQNTQMTLDVATDDGMTSSTRFTLEGAEVDGLDVETGIDEALAHLRASLGHLSGDEDGDFPVDGGAEPVPGDVAGQVPGADSGLPGGAMPGAALAGAAAGIAGMAAAARRRRGQEAPPPPAGGPAPPTAPVAEWYYSTDGRSEGPCTLEALKRLLAAGTINAGTPVWSPGLGDWRPASEVPALRGAPPGSGGAGPPPVPQPRPAEWYFAVEGRQKGPVTLAELRTHIARGTVPPEALVWKAGMDGWVPASSVPELWG